MPSSVTVNSNICGFVHTVHGKLDGKNIIIDIETPCEKIKKMSHMEVPIMETMVIKDNYVMNKAQELQCTPICIVPCAVLHVCRMESGMLSKTLARKMGNVSIEFNE